MTDPVNDFSMPATQHWVASNQQLAALCQQLQSSPSLAIDTEFMRTNTYFPKLALIQLSTVNSAG